VREVFLKREGRREDIFLKRDLGEIFLLFQTTTNKKG